MFIQIFRYCISSIESEHLELVLDKHDRKQGYFGSLIVYDITIEITEILFRLWSIDLAFILHELGIRTSFYTKMLGADENYANTTYYASSFAKDETRVNELFQLAERKGMKIFRK